jgi:hypothetical protein
VNLSPSSFLQEHQGNFPVSVRSGKKEVEGTMKSEMYNGIATQWEITLGNTGIPAAAAKELGRYIGGLEKRIAELQQRITDLARTSAITVSGQPVNGK